MINTVKYPSFRSTVCLNGCTVFVSTCEYMNVSTCMNVCVRISMCECDEPYIRQSELPQLSDWAHGWFAGISTSSSTTVL